MNKSLKLLIAALCLTFCAAGAACRSDGADESSSNGATSSITESSSSESSFESSLDSSVESSSDESFEDSSVESSPDESSEDSSVESSPDESSASSSEDTPDSNSSSSSEAEDSSASSQEKYSVTVVGDVDGAILTQAFEYDVADGEVEIVVALSEKYSRSLKTATIEYKVGDGAFVNATLDEYDSILIEKPVGDIVVKVTGIQLNRYAVNFYNGNDVAYTTEVIHGETLTETQLADALANVVVEDQEVWGWKENTDESIVTDTSIHAVVANGISTAEEFAAIEQNGNYFLTADIDFSGKPMIKFENSDNHLTGFQGIIDGRKYTITASGDDLNDTAIVFWRLDHATVKNVTFDLTFKGCTSSRSGGVCRQFVEANMENVVVKARFENLGQAAAITGTFYGGLMKDVEIYVNSPAFDTSVDGIAALASSVDLGDWSNANSVAENIKVHLPSNIKGDTVKVSDFLCNKGQELNDADKLFDYVERNVNYVYDCEKAEVCAWTESVFTMRDGAISDEEAPAGYNDVYEGSFNKHVYADGTVDDTWTYWEVFTGKDSSLEYYRALRFAIKTDATTGSIVIGSDSLTLDGIKDVWTTVEMYRNAKGTWNVYRNGETAQLNLSLDDINEIFARKGTSSDVTSYKTYITEVYVVGKSGAKLPTLDAEFVGEKVADSALANATASTEAAPAGYENVTSIVLASGDEAYKFADIDISAYTTLKFKACVKGVNNVLLRADGSMAGVSAVSSGWREIVLTNNNNGTWTVTEVGYADTFTVTATSLKDVFVWVNYGVDGTLLHVTELRGESTDTVRVTTAKGIAVVDTTSKPSYDELAYAADELQRLARELFGKTLTVTHVSNLDEVSKGYFVIGYDLAQLAGLDEGGLTTDTGYRIVNKDGNVYLYGKTKYGSLNAVYGLFENGAELTYFSDTVYTYNESVSDIVLEGGEVYAEFNPSIDYNWAADGVMTTISGEYADKANTLGVTAVATEYYENSYWPNWDYQRRLGYVNSWEILGSQWHNFTDILPYDTYGADHPNWYAEVADWSNTQVKTLKLSYNKFEMVPYVAQAFYALIKSDEANGHTKTDYIFAPPDSSEWPENAYGYSASEEYLRFMNKLAKYMDDHYSFGREINILMLAYNATLEAPTNVSSYDGDEVDVAVMYAPIYVNMYRSITDDTNASAYYGKHTNSYYFDLLKDWQSVAGENKNKVYYWNYSAYYDNYFVPLDTITNMQSTYQALANSGVKVLLDLGQKGDMVSSDFAALKAFLKGQLARNVNAVLWTDATTLKGGLVEKFMKAYYGAGGDAMLTLLKTEMDWYQTLATNVAYHTGADTTESGEGIGHHSGGSQLLWQSQYWDNNYSTGLGSKVNPPDASMLKTWYGYIQTALTDVNGDATLTRRINIESMPIRYLLYRMYNCTTIENTDDNTQANLIAFAKSLGFTQFGENADINAIE